MLLLAAIGLLAAVEDPADDQRQPDRPALLPRGYLAPPDPDLLEEAVVVEGFRMLPLAELGADNRAWEFHPKALLGLAWDDNPLQSEAGSDGDLQERVAVGFEARTLGRDGWRADLGGMLRIQHYEDTPSRSFIGGDAQLRVQRIGETFRITAQTGWERTSEPLIDFPDQVERETSNASLAAVAEAASSRWSAHVGYSRLDYLESTTYFDSTERDQQRWSAAGAWSLIGGSESLLGVEAMTDAVRRPEASTANDFATLTAQGRWRHALGARTLLDLRLGATLREHDDDSAGRSSNDDKTLLSPVASVQLMWGWEERSRLTLTISHTLVDGVTVQANAAQRDAIEFAGRVRLLDRVDLVTSGWYSHREDSSPGGGSVTEIAEDAYVRLGVDYRLRDGLGVRSWAAWQDRRSSTNSDYDRLLVALELVATL